MIRVCSLATAGVDWVVSARGVQSAARSEWAKSRLKGERHGPAAAWQTTGGPAGDQGEQGKEEDQESLGSRAVSCHGATATGATWPRRATVERVKDRHQGKRRLPTTLTPMATPTRRRARRSMVASAGVFWVEQVTAP
ncbi:hypothetical protein IQ06DRAFT_108698 [Phaeosphaeriaceae sp. SRC1lsM3a]|nr:hypothetical protein IQ06DRAFT_108698 [Stagonospora sp. SRC1lsM3a]